MLYVDDAGSVSRSPEGLASPCQREDGDDPDASAGETTKTAGVATTTRVPPGRNFCDKIFFLFRRKFFEQFFLRSPKSRTCFLREVGGVFLNSFFTFPLQQLRTGGIHAWAHPLSTLLQR